ncbi:MAG: response regulator [Elusimicrobia bacterium]|nr:response regulator [Elusimicrobiota bacterium]
MTPTGEEGGLRILMLEDDPGDAALIRRALARTAATASTRWARTRAEFIEALENFSPHLVLSDYKLPVFDGLSALALVREKTPDIPFILVSGTIGEDAAVEALKRGATDYVLKNHLERLELVLNRALRERREREERLKAEAALRESQAKLLQSQKMEALGRLSGGVAHDFNNILTAITGLLTFSRRQVFAPKVLDLNRVLAELDRMLQRIIGEDIKLTIVPAGDLAHVRVDVDQIGQVILNLVVNARDAMPQGGTIVLDTANVELDETALSAQPDVRPGRFVRLSVRDSGAGMDAGTLSRLFEPFFTTKSKGTGLGLATVYGIVKQSNGFIEVDSRPGAGAVFRVYLPAVEGAAEQVLRPPAPGSLRGDETVLVVDDDAAVALIARRILESHGYAVVVARGGEEALRLYGDPGKPLDLIVTDVVMTAMSGPELARRLKAARPGCRLLFTSGYAEEKTEESSASSGHFISKPFTAADLLVKVRQILDAPPP